MSNKTETTRSLHAPARNEGAVEKFDRPVVLVVGMIPVGGDGPTDRETAVSQAWERLVNDNLSDDELRMDVISPGYGHDYAWRLKEFAEKAVKEITESRQQKLLDGTPLEKSDNFYPEPDSELWHNRLYADFVITGEYEKGATTDTERLWTVAFEDDDENVWAVPGHCIFYNWPYP